MSDSTDWDRCLHDAEDAYREAAMRWGGDAQMAKAAEEFSELSAACSRDLNGQADPEAFLEEFIDARIMMEQLAQHITDEALQEAAREGLEDLDERLADAAP